jgi:Mrp family chromosome partitioning ATPase/capsular polysaccharide biosynthesis protein
MSDKNTDAPNPVITRGDIYFVLFRRKRLILGFFLVGILAALAFCFLNPPQYKSEAELSLAVFEARPIGAPESDAKLNSEPSGNTINTELRLLQSRDLAHVVVQALTPAKILPGAANGADTNAAVSFVEKGLLVEHVVGSSVIHLTFQHPNREIVQPALTGIIGAYFIRHFMMWGGGGVSLDVLMNNTARLAANISIIQSPTPPVLGWSKKTAKIAGLLASGGILAGLSLAFFLELVLDRSVKRPSEIITRLGLPLLISIPDSRKNGHGKHVRQSGRGRFQSHNPPGNGNGGETPRTGVPPWDREHPLRQFYEGLRDRLIVYFEVRNAVHKPKLLAVTSCGHGAGVSSTAAGLAATVSETGDGNVLLVNISGDRGAARQFYNGEPDSSLDEALETEKKSALVKANLYTFTEPADGDMQPASLPRKLSALIPRLKASEYSYIIFDMPPVNRTSVTARLSGLMDMVLLVIESEKTNQDVVKHATLLLAESRATVSTVLNKSRNYVPPGLHQEYLNYV